MNQIPGEADPLDEPEPPKTEAPDVVHHDPTGLDLATRIAEATIASGTTAPTKPARRRKSQRTTTSRSRLGDPIPLGEAVAGLISKRGWTREINLKAMLSDWPGLVGPTNADHSTPEAFVNKVLTIRADSTAWASSLRLLAPQLLAKLNASLGDGTVTRIEILGPSAPSWKHGIRTVRDGRGPRDTYG